MCDVENTSSRLNIWQIIQFENLFFFFFLMKVVCKISFNYLHNLYKYNIPIYNVGYKPNAPVFLMKKLKIKFVLKEHIIYMSIKS